MDIDPTKNYTPGEVADFLSMTTEHVRHLLRTGVIAGWKVGKDWRVPGHCVLAALKWNERRD